VLHGPHSTTTLMYDCTPMLVLRMLAFSFASNTDKQKTPHSCITQHMVVSVHPRPHPSPLPTLPTPCLTHLVISTSSLLGPIVWSTLSGQFECKRLCICSALQHTRFVYGRCSLANSHYAAVSVVGRVVYLPTYCSLLCFLGGT
jgi:hypothetical protein